MKHILVLPLWGYGLLSYAGAFTGIAQIIGVWLFFALIIAHFVEAIIFRKEAEAAEGEFATNIAKIFIYGIFQVIEFKRKNKELKSEL